jgi:hypothetical protein
VLQIKSDVLEDLLLRRVHSRSSGAYRHAVRVLPTVANSLVNPLNIFGMFSGLHDREI